MGGVAKTVGNVVGTGLTLGLNKVGGSSNPLRRFGDFAGSVATGGQSGQGFGLRGLTGNGAPPSSAAGDQQSPMDMLVNTGGAPLLANIAMGANVDDALASFLGVPKDQLANIDGVDSLKNQLTSIQSNTNLKNQAVQKLVNDFPNYMQDLIPKYAGIADKYTQAAANQALQGVASKYAAGGQLSSGATAQALSNTAANNSKYNLEYGTAMAGQDWQNQFNEANALRSFQNKMIGDSSQQGFNAVQNALSLNAKQGLQSQSFAFNQNRYNQEANGAFGGALGKVGGGILGGAFGGPAGSAIGAGLGGAFGSYLGGK